jgi:class 3 adenylate cyclase
MDATPATRRLAAIVIADVVGFTRHAAVTTKAFLPGA